MVRKVCHMKLLLILCLVGCSPGYSQEYFPLKDGAQWEYSLEMLAPSGQQVFGRIKTRVDGTRTINGVDYFKVISISSGIGGAEPEINYFRASPDGIYILPGTKLDQPEQLYLPASPEVGSEWHVQVPESDLHYTVQAIETAELFDKKYENCLKISVEGTVRMEGSETLSAKGVMHLAPSIGTVSSNLTMANSWGAKAAVTTILKEYVK